MILAVSVEAASLEGTGHLSKTWTVGYLRYHGFVEGGKITFLCGESLALGPGTTRKLLLQR